MTTSVLERAAPHLAGLVPLARRLGALDPRGVLRIKMGDGTAACYAQLPFGVLVGRTVRSGWDGPAIDCAVGANDLVSWLDGGVGGPPSRRDLEWRGAVPPVAGWQRIERIPGEVVRDVVRKGASTFREAAGDRGTQPPAEVADALLDSVVLTATDGALRAEITLRAVSALTRMGFLSRGSHAAIDVCGRWSRVAAEYGSVYAERPGLALGSVS
jgi:hypothetical protein